ncbi:hypothetical protein INR49_024427 [Caranx melampygus]|nr:hypothetical protein INR49_024427 [Caranx melampygus]
MGNLNLSTPHLTSPLHSPVLVRVTQIQQNSSFAPDPLQVLFVTVKKIKCWGMEGTGLLSWRDGDDVSVAPESALSASTGCFSLVLHIFITDLCSGHYWLRSGAWVSCTTCRKTNTFSHSSTLATQRRVICRKHGRAQQRISHTQIQVDESEAITRYGFVPV